MEHYQEFVGKTTFIAGWGKTLRFSKKLAFIELSDGSGPQTIQAVVDVDVSNYSEIEKLRSGCSLGLKGTIVESPGSKQLIELQIKNDPTHQVRIYGECPAEKYPLSKKEHTLEVYILFIFSF